MGLTIYSHGDGPFPRASTLTLVCDGDHDNFPPAEAFVVTMPDGFVENHAVAMKAGWLERQDKTRGRIFLCPDCSGKKGNPNANARLL